ncbi:BlaI/MecI/CopY family transcriptional regulator [Haloferula sp.]|uniref:BlaI/MecI/CopY family transcriptional regulator n=1 Tax=Haloferula sp. TaxID=2497595 RepID=UPI00329F1CB4
MSKPPDSALARRERQVMDILYRLGEASAQDILDEIPDPPSYSAVRALLATMMEKSLLNHRKQSRRYLYRPAISETKARRAALNQLIATFFHGRPEELVASLLDPRAQKLSPSEIEGIRQLIKKSAK